jgi:hypothetical protein
MFNKDTTVNNDPYANILVGDASGRTFRPSFLMNLYFFIQLVMLLVTSAVLVLPLVDKDYLGAIFVFFVGSLSFWTLIRTPKLVRSLDDGLSLEFLLTSPTFIGWHSIKSLMVRPGRGTWATLQTERGSYYIPVEFSGIRDSRIFVRLVVKKSPLQFVKGNSFNRAFYERRHSFSL